MNIGILRIRLRLPQNASLKDKRQVVKSITARMKNRFNVSVAEVADNDKWQLATLGISCVSNDGRYTDEVLAKVKSFVDDSRYDAEIIEIEQEVITF
ncbi:MAG: DUF503 domain-containing protein [Chloroflexi bacterium]|nr:DUF503 domain-containing protein [Chloroflexota bacterium]